MESEIELHSQILKQFFEVKIVNRLENIENADKLLGIVFAYFNLLSCLMSHNNLNGVYTCK
jgi:hypothetical protein